MLAFVFLFLCVKKHFNKYFFEKLYEFHMKHLSVWIFESIEFQIINSKRGDAGKTV